MNTDLALITPPLPCVRWAWAKWLNPSQSLAAAESVVTALSYYYTDEFKGIRSVHLATSLRTVLEDKTCFSLGVRAHNSSVCIHVMNVSVFFHSYRRCETLPRQSRFNKALQSPVRCTLVFTLKLFQLPERQLCTNAWAMWRNFGCFTAVPTSFQSTNCLEPELKRTSERMSDSISSHSLSFPGCTQ